MVLLNEVQVSNLGGAVCTLQWGEAADLTIGALREHVGTHLGKPADCVTLIAKEGGENAVYHDDEQIVQSLLPADGTSDVFEVMCNVIPPRYRIEDHKWEYVKLKLPGKEPEEVRPQGAKRADMILWEDRWEPWDWKNGPALVNTAWKRPRFHSPGVTPGAIEYAVKGYSDSTRPCQVVIVSEGWNNEDPNPEQHPGQLPVMDEAKEMLRQAYPHVELITKHGMFVQGEYNKQIKLGKAAVLMLHATC